MYRQIIKLEGSVANTALPDLDVTAAEIAVAQIQSIVSWPALATWGVTDAKTGVLDRLSEAVRLANGATDLAARFAAGGVPSLVGYVPNNVNQGILSPLDSVNSAFTIGLVARTGLAIGSYSASANSWWLINDNISASATLGALRFSIAGTVSTFAEYQAAGGPAMTANDWIRVVLIVDRVAGTITLRVNGVQILQKTGVLTTAVSLAEFAVGIFNTGSQAIRAAQYRSPIAFSTALAGDDLALLEAMLLEKTLQ